MALEDINFGRAVSNYSDYNQSILNQFPQWHISRRHRDSNSAVIMNAVAAQTMEELENKELPNFVTQTSLSAALTHPNEHAYSIDVSDQQSVDRTILYNLLRNSCFDIWSNPAEPPDSWQLETEDEDLNLLFNLISIYPDENFQGGKSIRVSNKVNEAITFGKCKFFQTVEIPEDSNQTEFTASVWAKTLGNSPIKADHFKFYVQVNYSDKPSSTPAEVSIVDSSNWQRHTLRITTLSNLQSITVGIVFEPDPMEEDPSFVKFTSFFLHETHTNNFWARHPEDKPYFIDQLQEGRTVVVTSPSSAKRLNFYEIGKSLTNNILPSHANISFVATSDSPPDASDISPIRIHDGHLIDGTDVTQNLIIGNLETAQRFGWGTWSYGKLIKYSVTNPSEVYGVYTPSFSSSEGDMMSVSSLELQCMVRRGSKIFILAKKAFGSSLAFMDSVFLMLLVIDDQLPKVSNDEEEPDVTSPIFLPINYTYYFSSASVGGSFGSDPYGSEEWGGATPLYSMRHVSMALSPDQKSITTKLEYGYESVIKLQHNYFLDEGNKVFLFRDPREDDFDSEVVVW